MKKTVILLMIPFLVLLVTAPAWAETTGTLAQMIPIDLTPLFQVVITTLATIITAKLLPWIKRRATADRQTALNVITRTLVYSAEQLYRYEKESGHKKLSYVKHKLQERGYDVDIDAIEAAVMEMKLEEPWIIEAETEVEFEDYKPPDDAGDQE